MNYQLSRCALCGSSDSLELSHIVPQMIVRALKKSSIGKIRRTDNPNQTVQDSEKHYMLCGKCEDLFSKYEKYFSDIMFHPFLKSEKAKYEYDERLFYYLTSLSWRSLFLDLLDYVKNHEIGLEALEWLINSERIMKEFLLKNRTDIDYIEHHIFFIDKIESATGDFATTGMRPHATFHRGIVSYSFCYEEKNTYGTLTNMMGILAVTLFRKGEDEKWVNTKILNGSGTIESQNQQMISVVGNELVQIMKTSRKAEKALTDVQREKIKERLQKAKRSIINMPVYQDWQDDERIAQTKE